jgi:hypothetical protein
MAAPAHVKNAQNALYPLTDIHNPSFNAGKSAAKTASLNTALTELNAAIADGVSPLTTNQKVVAKAAALQVQYALDMTNNTMNGSTASALNPPRGATYLHILSAYSSTAIILTS